MQPMLNHLLKENGDITQGLEKLLGLVSDDTVRVGSLPVARPPERGDRPAGDCLCSIIVKLHQVLPGRPKQKRV